MTIIWALYIALIFYNMVDAWQTIMLLNLGAEEVNPILDYFINLSGTDYSIFAVKAVPIVILGVLLIIYQRQSGRV